MKIIFCILPVLFLFSSCSNEPEFIYLKKLSGKQIVNYNYEYGFIEDFLIKNPPINIDSIKWKTYNYILHNGKDLCSIDSTITVYGSTFYKKTSNTSYFITNAEDPGGLFSNEIGNYPEDKLITYFLKEANKTLIYGLLLCPKI